MKKIFLIILTILVTLVANAQTDTTKNKNADSSKIIVDPIEHMPEFPGGIEQFYKYLAMNIHFPREARDNHEHGKVIVRMFIETDGSVSDVRVVRKVSRSIDAEAIRLVKGSPKWNPATIDGVKVRASFSLPISFNYGSP